MKDWQRSERLKEANDSELMMLQEVQDCNVSLYILMVLKHR
jgi:hypothetical protein